MDQTMMKKQFAQLQFCLLLLACTVLPDFGSMISSVLGLGSMNFAMMAGRIIGLVGAGLALNAFYKSLSPNIPVPYFCVAGIGMALVLLSLIPGLLPMWIDYVALLLLFIAIYMGKDNLKIEWKSESTQGAYIVMLATLLQVYHSVDSKIATSIASLVGVILLLVGLGKMAKAMDAEGTAGIGRLKIAAWIGIVAAIIGLIPLIGGIIGGILCLVAFIFEFLGYGNLQHAQPLHMDGQLGAGKLRTSMILMMVAAIVGIIPFVGMVGGFLTLIALFFIFQGWTMIIKGLEE